MTQPSPTVRRRLASRLAATIGAIFDPGHAASALADAARPSCTDVENILLECASIRSTPSPNSFIAFFDPIGSVGLTSPCGNGPSSSLAKSRWPRQAGPDSPLRQSRQLLDVRLADQWLPPCSMSAGPGQCFGHCAPGPIACQAAGDQASHGPPHVAADDCGRHCSPVTVLPAIAFPRTRG